MTNGGVIALSKCLQILFWSVLRPVYSYDNDTALSIGFLSYFFKNLNHGYGYINIFINNIPHKQQLFIKTMKNLEMVRVGQGYSYIYEPMWSVEELMLIKATKFKIMLFGYKL